MEGVRIRAYEPDDVPAITAMFNQRRVAAGTLQVPWMSVTERRDRYTPAPNLRLLVAETTDQIVGEASLRLYEGRRKHVGSVGLAVDESFHGRGVGTQLMEAILDLADNWYNLQRIELQVFTDNASGIHLYEKLGFEIEGTHSAYAFKEGAYADVLTMARLRRCGGEG